jgi:hypothetical protein
MLETLMSWLWVAIVLDSNSAGLKQCWTGIMGLITPVPV